MRLLRLWLDWLDRLDTDYFCALSVLARRCWDDPRTTGKTGDLGFRSWSAAIQQQRQKKEPNARITNVSCNKKAVSTGIARRSSSDDVSPTSLQRCEHYSHGGRWLYFPYCSILISTAPSRPHLQPSFCQCCGSLRRRQNGAERANIVRGSRRHCRWCQAVMVIARVEPLSSPDEGFAKGNESDAFMSGEQPQGFAERPGPGPALQKRDDLAERGEQDLHHASSCPTAI
jgi:hypothetical protein